MAYKSDMAAAIISASVAIIVFAVGKWLEYRGNQTSRLQSKLEEYLFTLEEIVAASRLPSPPSENGVGSENFRQTYSNQASRLVTTMHRPNMFAHLYFPDSLPRLVQVFRAIGKLNTWIHDYGEGKKGPRTEEYTTLSGHLLGHLADLRKYLIDEQGRLTKRIPYTIFD